MRLMTINFGRSTSKLALLGALGTSGLLTACGDQKDPIESLNGDDTSSETSPSGNDGSDSAPTPSTLPSGDGTSETPTDPTESTSSDAQPTTGEASTTDEPTTDPEPNDDLCPMADGATWTYYHSSGWTEVQTVSAGEYEGETVFIVEDTPNPSDNLRADSYLTKVDGRLARVYKEQFWVNPNNGNETLDTLTTYGVGFLRCDEAWASKEVGWTESPEYERIETVAGDAPKPAEARKHTFTIEGRENVTTSGGKTFANCVKVRRGKDWAATVGEDVEEKLYWFCPGVGKVREENVSTGKTEELTEYSIPN